MFFLALTPVADLEGIAAQSTTVVSEPEKSGMLVAGTPHDPIAIDGDVDFSETALLEGWPGDGSPEDPYIIDELDIDLGISAIPCISISNTRVNFIIRKCNLTGARSGVPSGFAGAVGIFLDNVMNGELVENIVDSEGFGIHLYDSDSNTVVNNTCTSNLYGIYLDYSHRNTVFNNTCNNTDYGFYIYKSDSNAVVNNTCTSNLYGIYLDYSHRNTVFNNTCTSNHIGISLDGSNSNTVENNTCASNEFEGIWLLVSTYNTVFNNACNNNTKYGIILYISDSNTVSDNTCNNNEIGIYLDNSDSNTVVNNTCLNNTEHDIYLFLSYSNIVANNITDISEEFVTVVFLLIGLVGITLLGWWKGYTRGGPDEIIVPTRYRLVSWLRERRSLKHVDVDETHEPDSSDQ
jgi:parallel beta-helix repeat protein